MKRSRIAALLVPSLFLLALPSDAVAANFLNLIAARVDDVAFPADNWLTTMDLNIPDVAGVTGVTVTLGGGSMSILENNGGGRWFGEQPFGTLGGMKTATGGTWTISIGGSSPSTSTFSYSPSSLADGNFFAEPSITNPAQGASNVPQSPTFMWTDPTGAATPDALIVVASSETGQFSMDDSILGTLSVTDTSWTPPVPLAPGSNDFDVFYLDVDNGLVGDFSVTSGSIVWSDSPFDPSGGNANPLSTLGSQAIIDFNVVPEPSAVVLLAVGALGLLPLVRRRRKRA